MAEVTYLPWEGFLVQTRRRRVICESLAEVAEILDAAGDPDPEETIQRSRDEFNES